MWSYYELAVAQGQGPTGADLDRIAGTSSYGRAVLARWRKDGRILSTAKLWSPLVARWKSSPLGLISS